jgi:hypothetical protein
VKSEDKLAAIDAKILKLSIVSIPGPILTGLGLLGKYGEPDEIPFEFLNNDLLTSAMLGVGGFILLVTVVFIVKLGIAKANAESDAER